MSDLLAYKRTVQHLTTSGPNPQLAASAIQHLDSMINIAATGANIPQATIAIVDNDAKQLASACEPYVK
jgi:hypothetical protein